MEAQVVDISHNMMILMETLESKFKPFKKFGRSHSNTCSNKKSRDKGDPKKEPNKEGPSSNIISSQSLFKMERKLDNKPY